MAHEEVLKLCLEQPVPIDALTQPIALLANREGGKTYGGMKIFELAYDAGVQCGVLDPVGKWWGLRLGKDGKSPGLKDVYIFGGKHADFPLQPDRGAFIARLVVDKRIHFILDVSLMRKGERRRFMAAFLEELYLLKKQDNPNAMVLFLEEAHFVAPQKPGPDEAQMLGAIQDIVTEGRNAGIGVVLMDQRPARVNKDVLALVEVLIALRIIHNLDRDAIEDWIVQKADKKAKLSDELPFFKKGAGYLYAPVYDLFGKIQILPKRTYDSTASVKIGQRRADVGQLTPVDAEAVRTAMAEVLQEAEANDPKALKRRVAELERQLASRSPQKAVETRVQVPLLDEKLATRVERAAHILEEQTERQADLTQRVVADLQAVGIKLEYARKLVQMPAPAKVEWSPPSPKSFHSTKTKRVETHAGVREVEVAQGEPGPSAMNMLRILSQLRGPVSRKDLAMMSGYQNPTGSGFRNRLYEITGPGLAISSDKSKTVEITQEGMRKLGSDAGGPPPTAHDIQQLWIGKLEPTARKLFQRVLEVGSTTREKLASEFGYSDHTGSGFRNRLYEITGPGIVESEDGEVRPYRLLVDGPRVAA